MITGIDHIAIAVSDLQAAIKRFAEDLNLPFLHQETVTQASTETAFFAPLPVKVELIHPHQDQGPVAKFLATRGKGGLHHLCLSSDNLLEDIQNLKNKGYVFLNEIPQTGAHNTQVVWLHPKYFDGLLIEIAQPLPAH